jgi:hypothetical protein
MSSKRHIAVIADKIRANPECEALWDDLGRAAVQVVRDCVTWHKQKGKDPREVIQKMQRVVGAITNSRNN